MRKSLESPSGCSNWSQMVSACSLPGSEKHPGLVLEKQFWQSTPEIAKGVDELSVCLSVRLSANYKVALHKSCKVDFSDLSRVTG